MFVKQLFQVLLGGVAATGGRSLKRGATELGLSVAAFAFIAWCLMIALLVLAAALWLVLVPEVGAAGATAIIGALFILLALITYLVQWRRRETKHVGKRLDAASDAPSELQQQLLQSINANIGPLLIAAVTTFLVSRLTRRD